MAFSNTPFAPPSAPPGWAAPPPPGAGGPPPPTPGRLIPRAEFRRLVETRYIAPLDGRPVPPVFWYFGRGMPYALLKQTRPGAPLIFVIGGTGAAHDSAKSLDLANVFYQAGFNVVTLPSPTETSFIITASSDSVPGQLERDAADLYRAMGVIATTLAREIPISGFHLAGYSLGGTHAAYVSWIDARERRFDFRTVTMINPAVSLYNSVNRLDAMVARNLSDDPDATTAFIDRMFEKIGVLAESDGGQLDIGDPDFLFRAYTTLEPPERELELLIGLAFRLTSNDMAFASDVMTRAGYLVAKDARLTARTSLTDVLIQGLRLDFVNYFDGVYLPHVQAREPGMTRDALIARESLVRIEDYLRGATRVVLVGTQDDVILSRSEMLWLADVFGERARLFPTGGHCGSMDQREFVREMLRLIFATGARS